MPKRLDKPADKILSLRIDSETSEKLSYLSRVMGCTKSDFIRACIVGEYDRLMGNPQLSAAIQSLRDASAALAGMKSDGGGAGGV